MLEANRACTACQCIGAATQTHTSSHAMCKIQPRESRQSEESMPAVGNADDLVALDGSQGVHRRCQGLDVIPERQLQLLGYLHRLGLLRLLTLLCRLLVICDQHNSSQLLRRGNPNTRI